MHTKLFDQPYNLFNSVVSRANLSLMKSLISITILDNVALNETIAYFLIVHFATRSASLLQYYVQKLCYYIKIYKNKPLQ